MEHGRPDADATLSVTFPMVVLVSMVPFYIFIAALMPAGRYTHPSCLGTGLIPLQPTWALVYGTLYLFLILLRGLRRMSGRSTFAAPFSLI